MATTRLPDTAFKRFLRTLPIGSELQLDAPFGSFTLHHNATKAEVFLTGGIGITPVRSIVLQAVHDRAEHKIVVFYSNKRPEDLPRSRHATFDCRQPGGDVGDDRGVHVLCWLVLRGG